MQPRRNSRLGPGRCQGASADLGRTPGPTLQRVGRLIFVNQVAPYHDGPAGVHGVLGQAATALCELARLGGLEPVVVPDVGELRDDALEPGGVLALFNIGETPWSASQRRTIADAVNAGRIGVLGIHSATDACRGWDDYGPMLG